VRRIDVRWTTTGSTIILGVPLGLTGSLINPRGGIVVNGVKHPVTIKYYDDTSNANQSAGL
jgi:hypothetical protein